MYKKARKSFIALFVCIVLLALAGSIMNDLLSVSTGAAVYMLLIAKWTISLLLLGLIGFNIMQIFNIAADPFGNKQNEVSKSDMEQVSKDAKKDRILAKEKLLTKSDLILQKYMKD